ncbi:hypothetical protein [Thermomonospora umbrina]|uniref:Uncharacterized protein n=1 Tax=Thermomonospora umbrina TaxID=111806 RepID=A0A3D9T2Z1_9ACTN|nr:hypothetical protein [Thermomonospora umbrina]REE98191.1 hypothetical protein DFJ69_3675 [Thermomonospora umbrina]
MTERSDVAPDPADPPSGGDTPGSAFWNLTAVRRSDALMEALAARAPLPPTDRTERPERADPAVRLLHALVADVDADTHRPSADRRPRPVPATVITTVPASEPGAESGRGGRHRRPRMIVVIGVMGPLLTGVLATTGVAAAQGGLSDRLSPGPGAGERHTRERETTVGLRVRRGGLRASFASRPVQTAPVADAGPRRSPEPPAEAAPARPRPRSGERLRDRDGEQRLGGVRPHPKDELGPRRAPAPPPGVDDPQSPRSETRPRSVLPFADKGLRVPLLRRVVDRGNGTTRDRGTGNGR